MSGTLLNLQQHKFATSSNVPIQEYEFVCLVTGGTFGVFMHHLLTVVDRANQDDGTLQINKLTCVLLMIVHLMTTCTTDQKIIVLNKHLQRFGVIYS